MNIGRRGGRSSYLIRVTICLISLTSLLIMNAGCGTEDDPLDPIYTTGLTSQEVLAIRGVIAQAYMEQASISELTYSNGYWDDLRTPVNAVKLSGVKPPDWTSYKGSEVLAFGDEAIAGNEEIVYFAIQLPHGYETDGAVEVHVHYVLPADAAGNQVRWALTYSWADPGEVFPAAQTLYALTSATALQDEHHLTSFGYLPLGLLTGTKQMSSMILGSLKRNSSNAADTFANDVYLLEIDAHFEMDSPGSREESTK